MRKDNIITKGEVKTYADALILQYFEKYGVPDSFELGSSTRHITTIEEKAVMEPDDTPLPSQCRHEDGEMSESFARLTATYIQKATNQIVKFAQIKIGWNFDTVLESIIYSHFHRAYFNHKPHTNSHHRHRTSPSFNNPRTRKQIRHCYFVSKESPAKIRRPICESSEEETVRNPVEKCTRTASPLQWQSTKICKNTGYLQNMYVRSYSLFTSPRTSRPYSHAARKSEREGAKSLPYEVLYKMFQRDSTLANELYNCSKLASVCHENEDGTVVSSNAKPRDQDRAGFAQSQSPNSPQIHTPRAQDRKLSPLEEFAKMAYGRRVMSASPLLREKLRSGGPQSAYCGSTPSKLSRTSHSYLDISKKTSQLPNRILEKLKNRDSSLASEIYNCSESSFIHHDYDHNHEHGANEHDFQQDHSWGGE